MMTDVVDLGPDSELLQGIREIRQILQEVHRDQGIELIQTLGMQGIETIERLVRESENRSERRSVQAPSSIYDQGQQLRNLETQLSLARALFPQADAIEGMRRIRELAKEHGG
jgi:DNA-binding winged helix-turn-helix (wHTH) protein